jgi:hypothetical protein
VLAEGIAMNALEIIVGADELPELLFSIARNVGLDVTLEGLGDVLRAQQTLAHLEAVSSNATLMLLHDGAGEADVLEYLGRYALLTPDRARQRVGFIRYARGYVFTYSVGSGLVRRARARDETLFYRLLSEPFTPGQLRDLAG